MKASPALKRDTKWVFFRQGTCSRTLMYILNRDFGHPLDAEERAIDPVAGGILSQGYQCGMLWGASMATGAEAYRRGGNCSMASAKTLKATQHIMESFVSKAESPDCYDITQVDWTNKQERTKHMISGRFYKCFRLADKWAPEAIKAAKEGLELNGDDLPEQVTNCACEVVRRSGGSEAEMAMVSGFAGGLGLSGNACGALAAAIWYNSLEWCRKNPKQSGYKNPEAANILDRFLKATNYEFLCSEICGKKFSSIEDHSDFIGNGGCDGLMELLVQG